MCEMDHIERDRLNALVADLKRRLSEAEGRLADMDGGVAGDPDVGLAELIHDITCRENHTDGCGWHYESWERPGTVRLEYLVRANEVRVMLQDTRFGTFDKQDEWFAGLIRKMR